MFRELKNKGQGKGRRNIFNSQRVEIKPEKNSWARLKQ